MTGGQVRMLRLARAQGEMVKSLELRLAQAERRLAAISESRAELDRLAAGTGGLAFLPAALRKLAAAEAELCEAVAACGEARKQLLAARVRQKTLDARARLLRQAHERKTGEGEMLETTLALGTKASGKQDVLI